MNETWMNILTTIFEIVIIPLLGIGVTALVRYLGVKKDELNSKIDSTQIQNCVDRIYQLVVDCMLTTQQTYVDSLKAQGKFDEQAQKEAFNKTYEAIINLLDDDLIEFISDTFGDVNSYLTTLIEANLKRYKADNTAV